MAKQLPDKAWVRAKIEEGTKGPLVCDLACLRVVVVREGLPGPESWLIIRHNVDDPTEIRYYLSNAPAAIEPLELVRISGMRWAIEIIFRADKVEVGFDHYECVVGWVGITICSLLSWLISFLFACASFSKKRLQL